LALVTLGARLLTAFAFACNDPVVRPPCHGTSGGARQPGRGSQGMLPVLPT